jgi:predicted homoserine dehydrogenase-like protein
MTDIAKVGLARDLANLKESGKAIRIGVIGAGEMGTDLLTQVQFMDGMEVAAITSRNPKNGLKALEIAEGNADRAKEVSSRNDIEAAIEAGKLAVTDNIQAICEAAYIDVIIEATGKPEVGVSAGLKTIECGKHLVMMNVEADVTIGPYLKAKADQAGVVYTVGAGDEPSSTMELIEFVTSLGHKVVAAGKGKNNPFNAYAVPDDYRLEAEQRNMNPRMLVEFVDGSKTMVEMAAIANATGLVPDVAGMHGPAATLDELPKVLCPIEDGGILSKKGCVDYTVGKGVAPGVFVIAEMAHERLHERMNDLKLGEGPYFTFYRPHHLTSLEVPLSCARAVLYGKADMVPLARPVAEVCAIAKRDLKAGERLDAIGETSYRSWTMTCEDGRAQKAIPCGLLEGGIVTKDIKRDGLITYDNCTVDESQKIVEVRRLQDKILGYS